MGPPGQFPRLEGCSSWLEAMTPTPISQPYPFSTGTEMKPSLGRWLTQTIHLAGLIWFYTAGLTVISLMDVLNNSQ